MVMKYNTWTNEEKTELRILYRQGLDKQEISERMNRGLGSIIYGIQHYVMPVLNRTKHDRHIDIETLPEPTSDIGTVFRNYACEYFGMNLITRRRNQIYVLPRNMSINWIHHHLKLTLAHIAKLFNRDHSTVIHAIKTHENNLMYKDYRADYSMFKSYMYKHLEEYRVQAHRMVLVELNDERALSKAQELIEGGAFNEFVEYQLLNL